MARASLADGPVCDHRCRFHPTNHKGHTPMYVLDSYLSALDGFDTWDIISEPEN